MREAVAKPRNPASANPTDMFTADGTL